MRRRLVALAACSACSVLTSLDDLRYDGGAEDATPDVIDEPTADAAIDAQRPLCQTLSGYALCDDFEEDGSFFPPWTACDAVHGGSVVRAFIDSGCMVASMGEADASPVAQLTKTFSSGASVIHYSFDLDVLSYAALPSAAANSNGVNLPPAGDSGVVAGSVFLSLSSGLARLVEQHHVVDGGYSPLVGVSFNQPPVGRWTHFDVVIDIGASSVSLALDGLDSGTFALPSGIYTSGIATVSAGLSFEAVSVDQFSVAVDNTVVYLK